MGAISRRTRGARAFALLALAGLSSFPRNARAAGPLGVYAVDPAQVTVAGISSGGFMAVQLDVAYSARFHGAAIFAGGPYDCAEGSVFNGSGRCSTGNGLNLATFTAFTDAEAGKGTIDPTSHLAGEPVFLFSGTNDTTVKQPVMDVLADYYAHYGASTTYDKTSAAGHAWISPDGPNACSDTKSPFVNHCTSDAEETFLTQMYGALQPRATGALGGSFIEFDQSPFCGGDCSTISMDATGFAFVPAACVAGATCKLMVALHGCAQHRTAVGTAFAQDSGLDPWAETNHLIVLYPQAAPSNGNPLGCWDFWGYTRSDYALKSAPQMSAIVAMVDRASGAPLPVVDGGAGDGGGPQDGGVLPGDGGPGGVGDDAGTIGGGGDDGSGCGCALPGTGGGANAAPLVAALAAALGARRRRARRDADRVG